MSYLFFICWGRGALVFYKHVLVSSRLPSSTRYGAEAEPRGHIQVERGEAVN